MKFWKMPNKGEIVDVLLAVGIDVATIGQMPRLLKQAGCRASLISQKGLAVRHSRFVDRHVRWHDGTSSLVEALRRHLSLTRQAYRWIIIGDESLLWDLVDQPDKTWLEGCFPFPVDSNSVAIATSNLAFMKAAARARIPIPRFRIIGSLEEARNAASEIGYPVMVKQDRGASGSGIRLAPTAEDLELVWQEIGHDQFLMVQEFLEGELGETSVLFDHGRPLCWLSTNNRRPWPGLTCWLHPLRDSS